MDVQLLFFNDADFFPQAEDLIITRATLLKEKPDPSTLVFGTVFTDHMLTVEWSLELGWEKPCIKPLQNLSLHPGSSAFHYAVEVSTWKLMMVTYWSSLWLLSSFPCSKSSRALWALPY